MKNFHQFIESKKLESEISIAANLMVELNLNPAEFILEYVKSDKEMEAALLEYLTIQEGILDGIKAFGSNALKAAQQFGQNVWSGGGIKGGMTQASDTLSGPVAKYDSAVRVLGDLVKSLESRDDTRMMRTKGGTSTIPERIRLIVKELTRQKNMIPQMVSKTAPETQPEMKQRRNPASPAQPNPAQTAQAARPAQTTPANVSQPTAAAFQSTKVRAKPGMVPGTGVFSTN
jgi:hypothetical protein